MVTSSVLDVVAVEDIVVRIDRFLDGMTREVGRVSRLLHVTHCYVLISVLSVLLQSFVSILSVDTWPENISGYTHGRI